MKNKTMIDDLSIKGNQLRKHIIEMIGVGHAGHLGGSCSIADVIACLYFYKMKITPENIHETDREKFIMSKGHAVLAQYAALYELGFFTEEDLKKTKTINGILQGHPDMRKTPGIEANTGSLGQGLSIACGLSLGMRLNNIKRKIYVVLGDGELAEGQVWEAAMAASNFQLDNIVAIVDKNDQCSTGYMKDRFCIPNMKSKFESFGWDTIEIDGHDISEIMNALDESDRWNGKPFMIIANTQKGKGISFAEGKLGYHNCALDQSQYNKAMSDVQTMTKEG